MIRSNVRQLLSFALLLLCLFGVQSFAQTPDVPAAADNPAQKPPVTAYSPSPENYQKAVAYSSAQYRHYFINALYGLVILLLVLRFRVAPRLRDWAERASSRRFVQVIIFAPLLLSTVAVLSLASDVWNQQLSRQFGLSVQGWKSWMVDWVTNQVILVIVASILVWILYGVIRRSPRRWWFYFWLASLPILLAVIFIQPLVIDPIFFKFKPLADSQPVLVAEMEKVVKRGGLDIPPERMFEMNASSKLTGLNAYVAGFGASKRVVVWDTTLAKATIPETLFVFGHEMGHYVLLHIPKELTIFALILLALFYVGYRLAGWMVARWGAAWSVEAWMTGRRCLR